MSAQNVQIVRTLFGYWGTAELGRSFEVFDEDIQLELADMMPGFHDVNRGHDAVRSFWSEWLSAWEVEIVRADLEAAGDRVLATWTQRMTGRGSELSMQRDHAAIFTLREGKIVRLRFFMEPETARAEFAR